MHDRRIKPKTVDSGLATTDTGSTGTTGPTTTDTGPDPCLQPLPPGPRPVSTIEILTEEDFDFDSGGFIIYQAGSIVAENRYGDFNVIAPAFGGDPSGIQVLSNDDVVVVSDMDSTVHVVERGSGGSRIIMNGFSMPNGIEVGENDRVYVSDSSAGVVRWHEEATGASGQVTGELTFADNLVLSNDEQTLYVATTIGIAVLNRLTLDSWDPAPTYLAGGLGMLFVVEIDSCDNLYTALGTEVYRISPAAGTWERIADLPSGWSVSSLRWGNGVGGFERDTLYATMRSVIHAIDMDIDGRGHPTDP